MQDDPMDGGGRISSGMKTNNFLSVDPEHKKRKILQSCAFYIATNQFSSKLTARNNSCKSWRQNGGGWLSISSRTIDCNSDRCRCTCRSDGVIRRYQA